MQTAEIRFLSRVAGLIPHDEVRGSAIWEDMEPRITASYL